MKRLTVFLCLLLVTAMLVPMSARADVIYEPFDSFYEANRKNCTYVGRSYTANGPNGTVTLYTSPEDPGEEKEYPNGSVLYVSYTYQASDGILWGCCDNWEDNVTGWVPMDYLELVYDGQSFAEEYGDSFVPVQITLDAAELTDQTVYFWEYPGSSDYIDVVMSADYRPDFYESYTDPSGREWVHCGYFMGIKNKWVNLNDPTAPETELRLPVATAPAETEFVGVETVDEIKPSESNLKVTVTLAVAAVVSVTAVLLVFLKKKKV